MQIRGVSLPCCVVFVVVLLSGVEARAQGTLYGMFYDTVLESYYLGTIDPTDGQATLFGTGIAAKWISSDTLAIDADAGVAYLVAGPNDGASTDRSVYTVSIATGNQLDVNALTDSTAPSIPGTLSNPFETAYDPGTGTYYGLVQDSDTTPPRTWYMATIDPATGEVDPIGSGFVIQTAGQDAAFDPDTGFFYFAGTATSGGNIKLFRVSVATGAIVANPDLSSDIGTLSLNPDFLVWDPVADELLGLFGSTETDPRTRYVMSVNTTTGALTPRGDTFQEKFTRAGRGALDAASGTWYVELRPEDPTDFRLYALDIEADTGTVLSDPFMSTDDPNVRNYPDFLAFVPVPEPATVLAQATAVAGVLLLRRRRGGRATPS